MFSYFPQLFASQLQVLIIRYSTTIPCESPPLVKTAKPFPL